MVFSSSSSPGSFSPKSWWALPRPPRWLNGESSRSSGSMLKAGGDVVADEVEPAELFGGEDRAGLGFVHEPFIEPFPYGLGEGREHGLLFQREADQGDEVGEAPDLGAAFSFAAASNPCSMTTSTVTLSMACSASCLALTRASRRAAASNGAQASSASCRPVAVMASGVTSVGEAPGFPVARAAMTSGSMARSRVPARVGRNLPPASPAGFPRSGQTGQRRWKGWSPLSWPQSHPAHCSPPAEDNRTGRKRQVPL